MATPVPVVSMMYLFVSIPPKTFFIVRPALAASSVKYATGFGGAVGARSCDHKRIPQSNPNRVSQRARIRAPSLKVHEFPECNNRVKDLSSVSRRRPVGTTTSVPRLPFSEVEGSRGTTNEKLCFNREDLQGRSAMVFRRNFRAIVSNCILLVFVLPAAPAQTGGRAQNTASGQPDSTSPFASARKLLQLGKYDQAITELEALRQHNPEPSGLSHELGVAYCRKGDYVSAVLHLQAAQKENPKDEEAVQLTGLSLYLAGKTGEAIPYLERVQAWYPEANVDASYILGVAYIQTKKYPEARSAFAKMFGVPPDSAPAYLLCARMLLRLDFGPVAEEYGQKAIALDPKLPMAHFLLGELYLYQSKIAEATTQFEQELTINPGYAAVYYKLGDAYLRTQKFDEAEKLLQRSIWLDATATGPFILMGKVLERKGETELAVRALERAISMDPNNAMPHQLLGQAYRQLGRTDDAERELKQAERLEMRDTTKP